MDLGIRIEKALDVALTKAEGTDCPPGLAAALRYAVFPAGHRIRPRLVMAVSEACGGSDPDAADAAAAAIEFLHCASLVHDDLPCFDDADERRGKPSVHRAFGQPVAVLAGDALIVLAFETIARGVPGDARKLGGLVRLVGQAVGAPAGICAGQAWESEPTVSVAAYHRAKTASLFAGATAAGALAAGADPLAWRDLGERLGEAYQVADDISDIAATSEQTGKTSNRDSLLGRPNVAHEMGLDEALALLDRTVVEAIAAVPVCPGQAQLRAAILLETKRFLPAGLVRTAA